TRRAVQDAAGVDISRAILSRGSAGIRYIVSHDTRVGGPSGAAKPASHGSRMVDLAMPPMSRDHPCAGRRRSADRAGLMPVLLRSASQDIRAAAEHFMRDSTRTLPCTDCRTPGEHEHRITTCWF